jgi:hypothetical protein
MTDLHCDCLDTSPAEYDESFVGVDMTKGRFGDVSIRVCRTCGRQWLFYHVEYESFTGSGRWYAGLLETEASDEVSPESAVSYLESLPWHVVGGPYFGHSRRRGTGDIFVDL